MPTQSFHPFTPTGLRLAVCDAGRARRAFSLVEILVVVALLSVIILGLVAMFHQTQKALLSTTTQVDILEAGRAGADLMARDFEQMTPSRMRNTTNFYTGFAPAFLLKQVLADGSEVRSNRLEEVFFLSRNNLQWTGIAYFVDTLTPPLNRGDALVDTVAKFGIGSLYRYETNATGPFSPSTAFHASPAGLLGDYLGIRGLDKNVLINPPPSLAWPVPPSDPIRVRKILDGVVHFRVQAFDTQGRLLRSVGVPLPQNTDIYTEPVSGDSFYTTYSNAVPAYVELEIGVLESRTLQRFKTLIDNTTAATNFLPAHAAQVHLVRQRISIRNVDPSAYPAFP
ncbi:MAG: hypothetical protein JWR69_1235 [Pedosphaera sp.]|nr:hypothetical protein [Pedosphaera sp.]